MSEARVNLFERAIGYVAPRFALRREQARAQLDAARGYSGAALGRHTAGWRTAPTSADAEIERAGSRLRDRSRDLTRNNPYAAKAVSAWVNNLVGDGITPRPVSKNEKVNAEVKAIWPDFAAQCDADGQLDFNGMQVLAAREMVEAGEVLTRRRRRRASDGLAVPLQLQILEADLIDSSRTGTTTTGNVAIQGVEFDQLGKRANYWLFSEHPGNNFITSLGAGFDSKPIPADQIIHLYEKQRTQVRGVPWGASVIRALRDFEDYTFAEGIRKKTESSVVGVVLGFENEEQGVAPSITDSRGNKVEQFEPGLFAYARGGKDIKFNTPGVSGGYPEYGKFTLKGVAAGYRLPYAVLSADQGDTNFSGDRSGLVEFRRLVGALQWHLFIPVWCQPVWDWFCEAAYLAGRISEPRVPVEWSPPEFAWVDPYKDALAELLAIRAGTRTWAQCVQGRGRNPDEQLAEIAKWNGKFDAAQVILDCDPRQITGSGALQRLLDAASSDNNSGKK